MGSMSASDAAPLPRLGEVFFDVRGESRSMRLSWYADTGVAVFSIWQGGTCTGTFRLPIADLSRMVEALQRGPHGRDEGTDEGTTEEQAAGREMHRRGPARVPRPELLDSDVETGQTTAAIHLPPVTADPDGYPDPPDPGYLDEPPGGFRGAPQAAGYASEPPGGLPGAPLAPGHRSGPAAAPGYRDDSLEPGYRGGPLEPGYRGGPLEPGYRGGPPEPRYGGPPEPGYRGEPSEPGYRDEPPEPGYRDEPPEPRYPDEPRGRKRRHKPPAYREEPPGRFRDDPAAPGYASEPPGGFPDEPPAPGYRRDPAGDYQDEAPTGLYPGDPARGEYSGGEYLGQPGPGDYPPGPAPQGYPEEQGFQPYPEELEDPGYGSPARPYVSGPREGEREPFDGRRADRRKPRARRRAEPSPDSFPYGPPPGGDREPRQRGRYPGRD
jgi:hypothetical protein